MRFLLVGLVSVLLISPLQAQERYRPWSNPDASALTPDKTDELLKELSRLIDAAERDRAANPRFLEDLRKLSSKYGLSKPSALGRVILSDSFKDGDYTVNPSWKVISGDYWVEQGWGLRSAVTPPRGTSSSNNSDLSETGKTIAMIGKILEHAAGNRENSRGGAGPAAIIHTQRRISNQFSAELEISSWQTVKGGLKFGVYQGAARAGGYRLCYEPKMGFDLVRFSSHDERTIARGKKAFVLEDEKTHLIKWLRDKDGKMSIYLDGIEILSTEDRGYQDPFDGVELANHGGDYIIKSVIVKGQ